MRFTLFLSIILAVSNLIVVVISSWLFSTVLVLCFY
jgi:hypothetical protein